MRPPVGLVYRDDGVLVLDPDAEVQAAMRLVFETFDRTGSAMQTAKVFHEQGLQFPRRIRKGLNKGELHWVRAAHPRILQVLHNPRYAGAFVYGRVRTRLLPDGKHSTTKVPRSEWQFVIPDVHPGYITWEQFEANQKRLAENALGFGGTRKAGPAREGPALLQGRVICGICGERMSIHYSIAFHQVAPTYVCQEASVRRAEKVCQRVPGRVVDQAISNLLLELMQPMTLQVALAVQQEVEARVTETDALRRKQVERAQYEAELARRRYMKVDPLCVLRSYVTSGREMRYWRPLPRFHEHITTAISKRPSGPHPDANVCLVWSCLSLRSVQARQLSSPNPLRHRHWWYRAKHGRARRGSY
jgi:Recombinase/Recombinase zinc beta ribbon domain